MLATIPLICVALFAQDATTKPAEAPDPLQQLLEANDETRSDRLVAFLVDMQRTNAVFEGQYDCLRPIGAEVTPLLVGFVNKAPTSGLAEIRSDAFQIGCINALRGIHAEKAPEDIKVALRTVADDVIAPTTVRDNAKYALAQFGEPERVQKMLERTAKRAESTDPNTRLRAMQKIADIHYNLRDYGETVVAYGKLIKFLQPHAQRGQAGTQLSIALYNCACSMALSGQTDDAFKHLEHSLEAAKKFGQPFNRRMLEEDMDIRSLREDERFATLMEKYYPSKKLEATGDKKDGVKGGGR